MPFANAFSLREKTPASAGSTGATLSQRASLGTATATGKTLSPSERGQLGSLLKEQMRSLPDLCHPAAMSKTAPMIKLVLSKDGAIVGGPTLLNSSSDPGFRPLPRRACAPCAIASLIASPPSSWTPMRTGKHFPSAPILKNIETRAWLICFAPPDSLSALIAVASLSVAALDALPAFWRTRSRL